mgnify:CR=1 FL=1
MKDQIAQLIDKLAGDCMDCANPTCLHVCPKLNTTIGDVLQKIADTPSDGNLNKFFEKTNKLINLWSLATELNKSLQEIFAECEWEEVSETPLDYGGLITYAPPVKMPKQESHRDFWSFLLSLGL